MYGMKEELGLQHVSEVAHTPLRSVAQAAHTISGQGDSAREGVAFKRKSPVEEAQLSGPVGIFNPVARTNYSHNASGTEVVPPHLPHTAFTRHTLYRDTTS